MVVLNADMLGVSMCEEFGCDLWWTEARGESNECLSSEGGSGYRSAVLLVGVLMHGPSPCGGGIGMPNRVQIH